MRRGVWIFPNRPAGELVDAIVAAERAGLDEVWLADEGVAREPIPVLAAAAVRTSTIVLATGITSPLLRHPGAIASTAATLDELSGGRAVLGLGVGGRLSLDPFGLETTRPVAVLRDAIRVARAVVERRPAEGYQPPDHAMPARRVPMWVGARGPQLVRLAARDADGLFLSGCSSEELHRIVGDVAPVRRSEPLGLAVYQSAAADPTSPSELRWSDVASALGDGAIGATSIGINLIDPARSPAVDLVAEVERAAAVLRAVPDQASRTTS